MSITSAKITFIPGSDCDLLLDKKYTLPWFMAQDIISDIIEVKLDSISCKPAKIGGLWGQNVGSCGESTLECQYAKYNFCIWKCL